MLDTFRKHKRSLFGAVVIGVIAVLMLGFGLETYTAPDRLAYAAEINGEKISFEQYYRRLEQIRSQYRRQFGESYEQMRDFLNLEQQAIDSLINEWLLGRFFKKLGFSVGLKQVEEKLRSDIEQVSYLGGFDRQSYRSYLNAIGLTGVQLEALTRDELIHNQLTSTLLSLSLPTDVELLALHQLKETKYSFNYVKLPFADFKNAIEVIDNDKLAEFYELNKETYRVPYGVRYATVKFSPTDFAAKVRVTEDDLELAYEEERLRFRLPKRYLVAEIALPEDKKPEPSTLESLLTRDSTEDSPSEPLVSEVDPNIVIRQTLEEVANEIDAGELIENSLSAHKLSDKAKVTRYDWTEYDKFPQYIQQRLDRLSSGTTSSIFVEDDYFRLIQLIDTQESVQLPINSVEAELQQIVRTEQAPLYARAEAFESLGRAQRLGDGDSFEALAGELGYIVHTPADYLTEANPGESLEVTLRALALRSGEIDVVQVGEITYVISVLESRDSFIPDLDDVRESVERDYRTRQANLIAKGKAEALLELALARSLEQSSAELGLNLETTEPAKRNESQNELFFLEGADRLLFGLQQPGDVAPEVMIGASAVYVVELKAKITPEVSAEGSALASLRTAEAQQSAERLFSALLASLRGSAKIEVNPRIHDRSF